MNYWSAKIIRLASLAILMMPAVSLAPAAFAGGMDVGSVSNRIDAATFVRRSVDVPRSPQTDKEAAPYEKSHKDEEDSQGERQDKGAMGGAEKVH